MKQTFFVLSLFFTPFVIAAEGMDKCLMMKDANEKNFCMAKYSGSAAFCDKIIGYEKRQDCQRMVIRKQRESR